MNFLIVGLGGFIGAISRYLIGTYFQSSTDNSHFPYSTIIVNLTGCLLIGFLAGFLESKNLLTENIKLFVFIGILGGFTTFSAFGLETLNLFNKGLLLHAFNYVALSVILGIGSVWVGQYIGKAII